MNIFYKDIIKNEKVRRFYTLVDICLLSLCKNSEAKFDEDI